MERVRKIVRAEAAIAAGLTGKGVVAAILDSGVAMHPDLLKNIHAFKDFVSAKKRPYDDSGHGTHVAGCLCGNGICAGGKYRGIAPECRILACKVLDENGEGCLEDMTEAVDWCIRTKRLYGTKIVSLSVGLNNIRDEAVCICLKNSIERLWNAGMLPIVAAGNAGPAEGSISPLGEGESVIAVGCYDGDKRKQLVSPKGSCEMFSGRGKTGTKIRKPDLVAPGTGIISCCADFKKMHDGRVYHPYVSMNGTSMAVPIVSGAAALLWEKNPEYTNQEIRNIILKSARDLHKPWNYQGWGLLDIKSMLALKE